MKPNLYQGAKLKRLIPRRYRALFTVTLMSVRITRRIMKRRALKKAGK